MGHMSSNFSSSIILMAGFCVIGFLLILLLFKSISRKVILTIIGVVLVVTLISFLGSGSGMIVRGSGMMGRHGSRGMWRFGGGVAILAVLRLLVPIGLIALVIHLFTRDKKSVDSNKKENISQEVRTPSVEKKNQSKEALQDEIDKMNIKDL